MTRTAPLPFPRARRGDIVRSEGRDPRPGVFIGHSPAGIAWVRWLKPGELRTSGNVRRDVALMSSRLLALQSRRG